MERRIWMKMHEIDDPEQYVYSTHARTLETTNAHAHAHAHTRTTTTAYNACM